MSEFVCCTVTIIDENKIIEREDGELVFPRPYRLRNVQLEKDYFDWVIGCQKTLAEEGKVFAPKLFDEEDPLQPPIYCLELLSPPVFFSSFHTTGENN